MKEEGDQNEDGGVNQSDEEDDDEEEYWVGKGSETLEEKIWSKLCSDINQVPPCISIREVELMHGCDTQQVGMGMVHDLRLQEHLQTQGRPPRADK